MNKIICFDMDGTIADLYAVENWLPMLRAYDTTPYEQAKPMWDMEALRTVLHMLIDQGWEVRIITWLSKETDEAYKNAVREAKREWLAYHSFPYDHFHGVQYGATKYDSIRKANPDRAILIDDNAKVRNGWAGETIDPTACDLIAELVSLLR